jgi:hypothetical protein
MLRFDIDIWTGQQFANPEKSQSALFIQNWGIGDASGVDNNLHNYTGVSCSGNGNGGLTGDQISQFLLPGTHLTKSIYVGAPKNATILRLYDGSSGAGWTWDIPPAAG